MYVCMYIIDREIDIIYMLYEYLKMVLCSGITKS